MIVIKAIVICFVIITICYLLYEEFGFLKFIFHDVFKIHVPTKIVYYNFWNNKIKEHSKCKFCNKKIVKFLRDDTNWKVY